MRLVLASLVVMLFTGPLRAQPTPPSEPDRAAIQRVIRGQMEAFQRDDAPAAFSYASPGVQGQLGPADRFLALVQRGYAPVYRPRSVDFTTLTTEDSGPVQAVEVVGPDGLAYTALYSMEQQPDGSWRISGCSLIESRRVGT